MPYELDAPLHTQANILSLLGVPASSLQNWINRHLISLSEQNPGAGKRRLYSDLDVMKLRFVAELARLQVSPAFAADLASQLVGPRAETLLEWRGGDPQLPFLNNDDTVYAPQIVAIYFVNGEMSYNLIDGSHNIEAFFRARQRARCLVDIILYIDNVVMSVWDNYWPIRRR